MAVGVVLAMSAFAYIYMQCMHCVHSIKLHEYMKSYAVRMRMEKLMNLMQEREQMKRNINMKIILGNKTDREGEREKERIG